jgi:hypothetical protein
MADHKPGCDCKVCQARQAARDQRKAAAELEATRKDAAWMTVMGMGGRDAVIALARQHGDPSRAERLLEAAGLDPADPVQLTSGFNQQGEPVSVVTVRTGSPVAAPRQQAGTHQSGTPGLWASSPDHDPRVMAALLRPGSTDADIARIRAEVIEEYEGRRLERQRRDDDYYNRTGQHAVNREPRPMPAGPPMGFGAVDERGTPVQVSRPVPASRTVPGAGPAEGAVHRAEGSA